MNKDKAKLLSRLEEEGVTKRTIDAFAQVEQEAFIPKAVGMRYYQLSPIPVGFGEQSDDPLLLAQMIDLLGPKDTWRLLEVGGGSGYSSAILSLLVKELVTVEFNENLAKIAKEKIIDSGYFNVRSFAGDASKITDGLGLFDGALVLAACTQRPLGMLSCLRYGGVAVFPMGPVFGQQITRFVNMPAADGDTLRNFSFHGFCRLPSIRGEYGWVDRMPEPPEPAPNSDLP